MLRSIYKMLKSTLRYPENKYIVHLRTQLNKRMVSRGRDTSSVSLIARLRPECVSRLLHFNARGSSPRTPAHEESHTFVHACVNVGVHVCAHAKHISPVSLMGRENYTDIIIGVLNMRGK